MSSFVDNVLPGMKQLSFNIFFLCLISFLGSQAQQNHFIYIQTENKQPFYIKLEKQLLSSTASGYILLPKLKEGVYNLWIGFPKSEWPEQNMVCTVSGRDLGFLLKNFGDKGWGLFNMQTLDIVMAANKPRSSTANVETKTDEFSNLLSNVVNDPSIRQVEVVNTPAKDPVKEIAVNTVDTISSESSAAKTSVVVEVPKPSITRTLLNKDSSGTEMVFIDLANGEKDTIKVYIPNDRKSSSSKKLIADEIKTSVTTEEQQNQEIEKSKPAAEMDKQIVQGSAPVSEGSGDANKREVAKKESRPTETKFIEMEMPVHDTSINAQKKTNETPIQIHTEERKENTVKEEKEANAAPTQTNTEEKKQAAVKEENKTNAVPVQTSIEERKESTAKEVKKTPVIISQSPMINSDCKGNATEEDFIKLRKRMVGEDNDDDMIAQAKKAFKSKCFTVEQVKNLSVLFLKDSGKYAFFDVAYPFVSDSHNFSSLQNQLSDSYYLSRFQVMIRH